MNLDWDPEIDTPATIAVIGGGPIGVETALYARFLGYYVILFEQAKIGQSLRNRGQSLMPFPIHEVVSSVGLAALQAQGAAIDFAASAEAMTYAQFSEKYLTPVAKTDLLYESVHVNAKVLSISRVGVPLDSAVSSEERAEKEFRILVNSKARGEFTQLADIVLDCSGLGSQRQGMAAGGGATIGQAHNESEVAIGKRDVLGRWRERYSGKHTVMLGSGWEAVANAMEFQKLAVSEPATQLTWIVPTRGNGSKIEFALPADVEPSIQLAAESFVASDSTNVIPMAALGVEALSRTSPTSWKVQIQTQEDETIDVRCDEVINCASPLVDWQFATPIAAATQTLESFGTPIVRCEPHYYVLGQKSLPANRLLTPAIGFAQIRHAFAIIGGRADLNLFTSVKPL
ncbi:MAG: hypothetical protein KDB22_08110 [Planctomycetales bacterium]|nr:hypothetical protein [Planctomycetales bacterium]